VRARTHAGEITFIERARQADLNERRPSTNNGTVSRAKRLS